MAHALYGGVNAAVLTPMRPDRSVDLDRMAAHCRWLLANGCDGLGILGTTGEANSLGIAERITVMEGLVERGIAPARLMPGTGTPALPDTLLLTRRAAELGCPGVLVLPPFFYKSPSEDGLFAYFDALARQSPAETALYLYHFPAQSAVPITVSLLRRLREAHPRRFRGVKDSSGDFANTSGYIEAFAAEGFEVYPADDATLLRALRAGAAGCITAAANVGSMLSARVADGGADAEAAQAVLAGVRRAVTSAPIIPALKALMARHTGNDAWLNMRPPFLPLPDPAALFAGFDASGAVIPPVR
jgi:4-hydroxy-tetrahydrodipicolinate synthase